MKNNKPLLIAVLSILALVLVAGGYLLLKPKHKNINLTGTVSVYDTISKSCTTSDIVNNSACGTLGYRSCDYLSAYPQISEGAKVVVRDLKNSILKVSTLDKGIASGISLCEFKFTIMEVPFSDFYQIQVSDQAQDTYSYEQLKNANFDIYIKVNR